MTDRDEALARFFFSPEEPIPEGLPLLEDGALDGDEALDDPASRVGLGAEVSGIGAPTVEGVRRAGGEAEAEEPLYLGVFIGSLRCALPIGVVREVAPVPSLTEVPRGPRGLLGVGTVRGELLPVFDPAVLLFAEAPPSKRSRESGATGDEGGEASLARVVLTHEPRLPAIKVCRAEGVLQHGALEEASKELAGASQAVQGALRHRGHLWTVLAIGGLRP